MFIDTKKATTLITSCLAGACLMLSGSLYAANGGGNDSAYLKKIADNTDAILVKVNDIPAYIVKMLEYVLNMQKIDDSEATTNMQKEFATTGKNIVDNASLQLAAQPTLNTDLLGSDITKASFPNANDVLYSTLLGQPLYNPDPRNKAGAPPTVNPPYNYVKNAAGFNLAHIAPSTSWQGKERDYSRYLNYYNTVMSVESFSGYVLSKQLAELQNGNALTTAQASLVTQASDSNWIATIASEEIGKVLRQILIFESQTYVLMTELLQTQKQLLAAQVMSNTLLIANNQTNESHLLSSAQGRLPGE
jgi:hypothetical protein